eukprot:347383-Chlamydomonas_euryale.AAC.3
MAWPLPAEGIRWVRHLIPHLNHLYSKKGEGHKGHERLRGMWEQGSWKGRGNSITWAVLCIVMMCSDRVL